mmetsp:Transcript_45103/g.61543  ORF Transcript_45103/g.61543 Transcript_45103/m.61543 type:complete len:95 (-) Transcript_45103:978-1262(-)
MLGHFLLKAAKIALLALLENMLIQKQQMNALTALKENSQETAARQHAIDVSHPNQASRVIRGVHIVRKVTTEKEPYAKNAPKTRSVHVVQQYKA